jgi:hypothetical protein
MFSMGSKSSVKEQDHAVITTDRKLAQIRYQGDGGSYYRYSVTSPSG